MMVVVFLFLLLHQKNVLENFRAFGRFPYMLGVQILELNGHRISLLFVVPQSEGYRSFTEQLGAIWRVVFSCGH